ncbi:MAG: hypothetical protein PHO23_01545 [Candidatus Pacebacteria bacterium]|nr:hypothetical protein [Candidatus Paceibacterota bacterium]
MLVLVNYFQSNLPATPFVVIGETAFVYFKPEHKSTLLANIASCKENNCIDMTSKAFALLENPESKQAFSIHPIFYITGFLTLLVTFIVIKNLRKNKNEKDN